LALALRVANERFQPLGVPGHSAGTVALGAVVSGEGFDGGSQGRIVHAVPASTAPSSAASCRRTRLPAGRPVGGSVPPDATCTSHIEGGLVFGGRPPGAALCFRGRRTSTDSEEGIGAGNGTRTRDPLLGKAWVDYPLLRSLSESGNAPFANRSSWSPNCQSTLLYPYSRLIQANSLAR